MKKITINMLSSADKVDGQGVGSAYLEQVALIKEGLSDIFDVSINGMKDADILHHHTVDPWNLVKMKTTKGVNIAYVHFLPDTLDGSIKLPKLAFNVFKKYVINFYNAAQHLVVVNPIFIKDLVEHGIPRDKITYIPNFVSKNGFFEKTKNEIEILKEKYEISKDKFVVLGVGQVQTRKGVKDFVEVAKSLPNIEFIWCGGFSFGKITDGYEELTILLENPPTNVKFLGIIPRAEMNDMYNMADVLFMPSYNELFPMTILEACNLAKPMVLRNLELYEDILFNKYIYGNSNKEFKNLIETLSTNSEKYENARSDSRFISEFYSAEHVRDLWRDYYLDIYQKHQKEEVNN